MRGKGNLIAQLAADKEVAVLCVTETWLLQDEALAVPPGHKHRHFLHTPRPRAAGDTRRGGGVGILIDTTAGSAAPVATQPPMPPDTELYRITALGRTVMLAVVYAPQQPAEQRAQLAALEAALAAHPGTFIVGDFNAHIGHRGAPIPRCGHNDPVNASGQVLLEWLDDTGRQVMNGQQHLARATPTWASGATGSDGSPRSSTMIDLVLAPDAAASQVLSVNTTQAPAISDHRMVMAVLECDRASLDKWRQLRTMRTLQRAQPRAPGVFSPLWRHFHHHVTKYLERYDGERQRGAMSAERLWKVLDSAVKQAHRTHIRPWRPPQLYDPPSKRHLEEATARLKTLQKRQRRLNRRVKRAEQNGNTIEAQAAGTQRAVVAGEVKEAAKGVRMEARILERAQQAARTLAATTGILSSDPSLRHQKHTHDIMLAHDRNGPRHGAGQCRNIGSMVRVNDEGDDEVVRDDQEMADLYAQHLANAGGVRQTHPDYVAAQQHAAATNRAEPRPPPDLRDCPPTLELPDINADITAAEVEAAIRSMPYHKAGGPDGINSTSLKFVAPPPKPQKLAASTAGQQPVAVTPPSSKLGVNWLAAMFNKMLAGSAPVTRTQAHVASVSAAVWPVHIHTMCVWTPPLLPVGTRRLHGHSGACTGSMATVEDL